jgi:MoxR-like ATPase
MISGRLDSRAHIASVRGVLGRVLQGKSDVIDSLLVGVLAGGHVLIEDVPGVGKTTMAQALARAFGITFTRVQFTPDLLPTDILGSQVLNPRDGTFAFHKGPIFTNVLLADEINRASPRTQSALLEAMNEAQATIDGVTYPLAQPFFVLATQNPVDYQGTYPLPEAQLDRFLLRIAVGYPPAEDELAMLYARQRENPLTQVTAVCTKEDLLGMQAAVREVEVKEPVARYLLQVVRATRDQTGVSLGISPRGALAFFRAVQARAFLSGRPYASPEDAQALAPLVLAHRIGLSTEARYGGTTAAALVRQIVAGVAVPT